MKKAYLHLETHFETFTSFVTKVLGSSITFLLALTVVIYWIFSRDFLRLNHHDQIGDLILGISFLTLFILQKAINKFTVSTHLKINELVASQETASNLMINVESRTEHELKELSKEFTEMALMARNEDEQRSESLKESESKAEIVPHK